MHPLRKRRLIIIVFLAIGATLAVIVSTFALRTYVNHFYLPEQVVNRDAPLHKTIRAGGYVLENSIVHDEEGLGVSFVVTDRIESNFRVHYTGILPSLFREGQETVVVGKLDEVGTFKAHQVLAKHDENYVPPELKSLTDNDS